MIDVMLLISHIGRANTHLHDDQGHAAEADGGLEGGHGLGVGQPIQTRLVHPQQQVSLLKTRELG